MATETALRGRARALLLAMTERARWIYALPPDDARAAVAPMLLEAGLRRVDEDAAAKAARYEADGARAAFVVLDSPELEVALIEAEGEDAPPILSKILDKTGFYAQSTLLATALDVRDPEAPKALRTLAHMAVAWDEGWNDLFLLHLASPDPVARHEAVLATTVAAMVAREAGPAVALLEEARKREKFPKLRETIGEAVQAIHAALGGPVEPPPEAIEPGAA